MAESTPMDETAPRARRTRARRGDGMKLRDEIIVAATMLFEASGDPATVSMANIAAEVGCTQPAIYLHFENKHALVMAAYDARFEQFRQSLRAAQNATTSPLDALVAHGKAYIEWGLDNPAAYRMLFMHQPSGDAPTSDGVAIHTSTSFQDQVESVQACIDVGIFPGGDARTVAIALWASTHGLVSLQLAKPDFGWPDTENSLRLTSYAHGLGIDALLRTENPSR